MANNTSQMIALLGAMRKQMNGAVADAMYYYGADYGLNYGVSLPTVRQIAREQEKDHALALYLYKQQVRELRLAALHIAQAEAITMEELPTWAEGVINSEIAEEMAFALLPHTTIISDIFAAWSESDNEFLAYATLMAAARSELARDTNIVNVTPNILSRFSASRIIAQGVVALLAAAYDCDAEARKAVAEVIEGLEESPAANYVKEEMSWRMEF
ncbi:MAG: DNA alkylation repair protein [Alistipes sp.]|nr:DNA alkylation repair protein [Alistipes sp.]MBP3601478.1 DNA alkylation repair protein [Alistipes sp.]